MDGHEERLGERVLVSGRWLDARPWSRFTK
jgi:hypothetical protein